LKMKIPKSHPRYKSLVLREKIVKCVEKGITSIHGLIAHGRGEAFDYLFGEKTRRFAIKSIRAASALLLLGNNPVISVNGNAAALCPSEIVELSKIIPAKLEVNIFHKSKKREVRIADYLIKHGAREVLLPNRGRIRFIEHNRRLCNEEGIIKADVVFVPLEDGDRCEALKKMRKKVITIDLNPLSRTARKANITIVDNVKRSIPLLIKEIKKDKSTKKNTLKKRLKNYNNKLVLEEALKYISKSFS